MSKKCTKEVIKKFKIWFIVILINVNQVDTYYLQFR